jgi:chemotaxis protein methyltransferase CheR
MIACVMHDQDCVRFLQAVLPDVEMVWKGFRKVRRQVCRKVRQRMAELALASYDDYRAYLDVHADERVLLDSFLCITISRFYRDRALFDHLRDDLLIALCEEALARGDTGIACWSAGCASGEEPYTLALIWEAELRPRFPALTLRTLATDAGEVVLARAGQATYEPGSLRDLPPGWIERYFSERAGRYTLKPALARQVTFRKQDVRREWPRGPFHLILCRYLVFTYYAETLRRRIASKLISRLHPGGLLVLGNREALPNGIDGAKPTAHRAVYRRIENV